MKAVLCHSSTRLLPAGVAAFALSGASCAFAQTYTSAHYSLEPVALDAAGLAGSSPGGRYAVNSSAMPGGAGFSGNYTALTGYAGQLKEATAPVPVATGIALRASPASVGEDGTRLISADLQFADGSWAPLSGNLVAWSVASGPLSGVSPAGLAAGAPVFRDTVGVVRGQYLGFSATLPLTVLNTLPDNYGAYAGDGLPDDWQVQYFGLNNPDAAPGADPDGDGFNNRFEYDARIAPADSLSTFRMFITGASGDARTITFYPAFDGCEYLLRSSSDLATWSPVAGPVSVSGGLRSILDATPFAERRFYQLDVRRTAP